jgi:hypothetical protein
MDLNLEALTAKQLNDLELRLRDLLEVLRKAKLHNTSVMDSLRQLEDTLSETRRRRFDMADAHHRNAQQNTFNRPS